MTQNSLKNESINKMLELKSSLDENNNSAWMAKKQRSKIEKDLIILQNRINLLTLEEERAKNKFQKTKKQTEKVMQLKRNIDEMRIYVYTFLLYKLFFFDVYIEWILFFVLKILISFIIFYGKLSKKSYLFYLFIVKS